MDSNNHIGTKLDASMHFTISTLQSKLSEPLQRQWSGVHPIGVPPVPLWLIASI